MSKIPILIQGMHGMGDNVHQRAVLRALAPTYSIWLETSWPCIYHDLVGPDLRLLRRPVALRTQLKNATREADKFNIGGPAPHHRMTTIHMTYGKATIPAGNTILQAMFAKAGVAAKYPQMDFSLPIPPEWEFMLHDVLRDHSIINGSGKPLMIYRPLVVRPEWRGSMVRNANVDDYAELFASIRDNFFVISVADLEPNREWIVGPVLKPDAALHKGELSFEALAALFKLAACVYTSSGFGAVLAPAVGTPCISIQGGFEPASWHADGVKLAPFLGIDPIRPCVCASSHCMNPCDKKLDMPAAITSVREFVSANCGVSTFAESRPVSEIFDAGEHPAKLPAAAPRIGHPSFLNRRAQMLRPRPPIRHIGV